MTPSRAGLGLALALALGAAASACDRAPPAPSTSAPAPTTSLSGPRAPNARLSADTPDPRALEEILAQVPAPLPPTSPSGSLVGTDTGVDGTTKDRTEPPPTDGATELGVRPDREPSSAGLERDLRATVYFDLVDRCRDGERRLLPPESVEIRFRVDVEGRIERPSVEARALDPRFDEAARCMVRVLRTSDARLAPARTDRVTVVVAKVPSVD